MQKQSIWYVGCLALLIGLAMYTLRQPAERGMQRLRLGPLAIERIDRIECGGSSKVVLQKEASQWRLMNGRVADATAVANLLRSIDETELTDFVTADRDEFADLGLESERATEIRLEANGREVLTFAFVGEEGSPLHGTVLAKGRAFRGDLPFAMQVKRDEAGWLDRHLFDLAEGEVDALTLQLPGERPYTLVRNEQRQLTLAESPQQAGFRFDAAAATSLLSQVHATTLQDFVTPAPPATQSGLTGVEVASWCVEKKAGDGLVAKQECLLVGNRHDESTVYGKMADKPDVFLLSSAQVDGLKKRPMDLRALDLMAPLAFDDVVEAGIERPKAKPMRFVKQEDGWTFAAGKPSRTFALDGLKLNQRLRKMTHARAIGLAADKEAVLKPSAGKIWLKTKDGVQHALTFGAFLPQREGMRSVWVRGTADQNIYRMSKPLYDELMAEPKEMPRASAAAPAAKGPTGLEGLPPEVRANIERQLAQQGQQG